MKPRLFHVVSPLLAAGLAWSLHTLATSAAALAEAPPPKIEPRDWTWRIQPNGTVRVLCKGSVVLDSNFVFWGKDWGWAPTASEFRPAPEGGALGSLKATVDGLKTEIVGKYSSPRPNVLTMDLQFTSSQAMAGIVGGGLNFTLSPDATVLEGRAGAREIPPGGVGWSWEPARGAAIRMDVEPALPNIYFDNGVRAFFLGQRVDPGTRRFRASLTFPEGATREPTPEERYDPVAADRWFSGAMAWDASPVDLRSLNADDRPVGRRGRVRAEGDRLVLGDGRPARFWGGNLAAYTVFATPRETVPQQARRMAQMGFNLMRITHNDSPWVAPNVFGNQAKSTRKVDDDAMQSIDWWIKCLKDEGIYTWLDVHGGRALQAADGSFPGSDEIARDGGLLHGYPYYNDRVRDLMREFQEQYLNRVNKHTGLAYKDDPAVLAVALTNENDLTSHYGHMFLPTSGRPHHSARFMADAKAFAVEHGLPEDEVWKTWAPGANKLFTAQAEHRLNAFLLADLRRVGYRGLAATTNSWGGTSLFALPALCDGDFVDVHSYGEAEFLGVDPRYEPNYIHWIGASQVAGKPLTASEWNVPFPADDRFASPLYTAALSAFQGWDAPMIYAYSQDPLAKPSAPGVWTTAADPALAGVMPAAALLYRKGQVAPARKTFHLAMKPSEFFGREVSPKNSAAIRTIVEQSRLTIGLPATRELPWLKPSPIPEGATVIDDPTRDMLPEGATSVRSDTGQLTRDWKRGVHVIDAPQCQAASGWIGGSEIATADARFEFLTKKAVVCLNSVDDQPLSKSRFILITAVARAAADPSKRSAFASEPVVGAISLKTEVPDLELMALAADGRVAGRSRPESLGGYLRLLLPDSGGTHWYVLKARSSAPSARPAP